MTTSPVTSITDELLAEIVEYANSPSVGGERRAALSVDELRGLLARLRQAEKDAERLDFIAQHPGWLQSRKGWWGCVNPFTNYSYPVFKTPREAIDTAMQGNSNG